MDDRKQKKRKAGHLRVPKIKEPRTAMKKGGMVSSASKRADGIAKKGKTKGRMV
jgi:hypothetical protein